MCMYGLQESWSVMYTSHPFWTLVGVVCVGMLCHAFLNIYRVWKLTRINKLDEIEALFDVATISLDVSEQICECGHPRYMHYDDMLACAKTVTVVYQGNGTNSTCRCKGFKKAVQ